MGRPPKGKTDAEKWLEKIDRARKVREKWMEKFRISLAYEYYEGAQRPAHIPEAEWITLNMIYSNLEAILPSLYSVDPYFYVKLKTSYSALPADVAALELKAKIRQAMVNYLKGELRLKQKCRLSIKDSFFQYGVIKVHYYAELEENEKAGEPVLDSDGRPTMDAEGAPILEADFLPANECYKLSRIHPQDFLVDEDAGPEDDTVSWKAQRVCVPLDEAKEDRRFDPSVRKNLKATESRQDSDKQREQRKKGLAVQDKKDQEPDVVVMWEVYDLKDKKWFIVADGNKDFLLPPDELPDEIDGDPFVDLRFTLRDDSWYPIPPVTQWLDSQREYCETRSKILVHRKRFNRKYELNAAAFEDAEKAAADLVVGEDGTVLIKNQPIPGVAPIQDAMLDMQVHTELAYLKQDFGDLAVGSNQRGSTAGVDSATEAGILEKRAIVREGDRVALVQDFVVDIGRKLDQCVQAHITRDQAVKVSGPQGDAWEMVRATDYQAIDGEYEYSVNVGATQAQLPEVERAQFTAVLSLFANAPQMLTSKRLVTKVCEMHHIHDEAMVDELVALGQMIMGGAMPQAQTQGSIPGVPGAASPMAAIGAGAGVNNVRGGAQ
jgi:hypothetical protein